LAMTCLCSIAGLVRFAVFADYAVVCSCYTRCRVPRQSELSSARPWIGFAHQFQLRLRRSRLRPRRELTGQVGRLLRRAAPQDPIGPEGRRCTAPDTDTRRLGRWLRSASGLDARPVLRSACARPSDARMQSARLTSTRGLPRAPRGWRAARMRD